MRTLHYATLHDATLRAIHSNDMSFNASRWFDDAASLQRLASGGIYVWQCQLLEISLEMMLVFSLEEEH